MALFSNIALSVPQYDDEKPYVYMGVIDVSDHQGYLAFTTDQVMSPYAKFAVEYAHDGLVHIRSCFNNRYWVRSSAEGNWIMAKASEPEVNEKLWNCTLFKIDIYNDNNAATIVHVQSGTTLHRQYDGDDRTTMFMSIDPSATATTTTTDKVLVIDLDTLVVLPKYVAFVGDNGKFFNNRLNWGCFETDDLGNELIVCEIVPLYDGNISIRLKPHREGDKRIGWMSSSKDNQFKDLVTIQYTNEKDYYECKFTVVKVENNVVGLRSIESGMFCQRSTTPIDYCNHKLEDAVTKTATCLVKEARFRVIEPVVSREVSVLEYDTDKSRIYNITPLTSEQSVFDNPTDVEQQATLNLAISTTTSTTWTNSVSITAGIEASVKAKVPFLAEEKVQISASVSYGHVWQGSESTTQVVGSEYTIKVPANTRVVATGVATQGTCDIPFNYVQIDKLTSGETFKRVLSDGVYTGVNAYNFYYKVEYFDIDDNSNVRTSLVHVQDHRQKKANAARVQKLVD